MPRMVIICLVSLSEIWKSVEETYLPFDRSDLPPKDKGSEVEEDLFQVALRIRELKLQYQVDVRTQWVGQLGCLWIADRSSLNQAQVTQLNYSCQKLKDKL